MIEPWGDRHDVPHLATVGIRYSLKEGAEDRCYSAVSEHRVDFWCNADTYEVDVVHPTAFDKLSWDICVNGGWCGGMVGGKPTVVDDLLPKEGLITAKTFAELTIRADGWPDSEPLPNKHLRWIEARFIEHLGSPSVSAEDLRRNSARPFGNASSLCPQSLRDR